MKVRITRASKPTYWYADKTGDVFEVTPKVAIETYRVCDDHFLLISASDCEEVEEEWLTEVNESGRTPWYDYWSWLWHITRWLGGGIELSMWIWQLGVKAYYAEGQVGFGLNLGPVELSIWIGA